MLLTRLPLRIATAFDLHVLGLPPAFVLSQDQTLKLNENLVPAGHYLYDESQAHLLTIPRAYAQETANTMNLDT